MESFQELSDDKIVQAGILYSSGLTTRQVAAQLGVSKSTGSLWVKKSGVVIDKNARISAARMGQPSPRKGATHTDEAKQKMREATLGHRRNVGSKRTEESKQKMRNAHFRRADREEHLKKLHSAARKVNILSDEEKAARNKSRAACKQMVRRILIMARIRKDATTEKLLGYSKHDLQTHLESQFRDGMGWSNRNSFHIDHIKPCAAFFAEGIFDPAIINALSNLQVLTPAENRKKSDTWIP